jgi:hypothetical protein
MIVLNSTFPGQLEILALLNARATQPRVQYFPDRRCGAAFLRRYVVEAFTKGMHSGHEGPWRVTWQRHAWLGKKAPQWAPLVVRGSYRLAVNTVAEAAQVQAMLNWFGIPQPQPLVADRRGDQRGRRPRLDRRGRVLSGGGSRTPSASRVPHTTQAANAD